MSTRKVILEGDTSRFAFSVAFQNDPDGGSGAALEESLSWGGFAIWVEGQNLCLHREGDTIIEYAHWYLLPLFEWFSACWDYLLHEQRLPLRVAGDDSWTSLRATAKSPPALNDEEELAWEVEWQQWWLRHSLLACRQGGLFPDVMFRRWRDLVEVSWGQRRLAGQPEHFRFLAGEGFTRLPVPEVAQPIYSVLCQAESYLLSLAPTSRRFLRLKDGLESLSKEHETRRLSLLAGIDTTVTNQEKRWDEMIARNRTKPPAAVKATFHDGIEKSATYLAGSCQAALMFGSVAPTIDEDDTVALAGKLIDLYSPGSESSKLGELVREEVINDSLKEPWAQGYRLAEDFMEELSLPADGVDWVDIRAIYNDLGIHIDQFFLKDRGIRAVSVAGPDHRTATLLNPDHPTYLGESGQRFTLAHELCHILFDRGYGARLAIASGPWAPRDVEARANAFAAMLLMPTDLVNRLARSLAGSVDSVEGIREIADRMHTSFKATLEHLKNLNFLSQEEHDFIEMQERQGKLPG